MGTENKLFVVLLGGREPNDKLEAHNLFVGIGPDLKTLLPDMQRVWPGATHVDAYMILEQVDGYAVTFEKSDGSASKEDGAALWIANIGYYKKDEFGEFHKLIPLVLEPGESITARLKGSDFDFNDGQKMEASARSHVDDSFDIDDEINVQAEVPDFKIVLTKEATFKGNPLHIGYIKFSKL